MLVGSLAIATIIGAAAFVLSQSTSTKLSAAPTANTAQIATKETTSQATDSAASTATAPTTSQTTSSTTASTSTSSGYKDGTYTAAASYSVPRSSNTIDVSLTVKDGVVTAVKTSHNYSDRESGMYIDSFDSSIQSSVVGKSIGSLTSLSRVGGASLTTYGFEDALATIANQAKA